LPALRGIRICAWRYLRLPSGRSQPYRFPTIARCHGNNLNGRPAHCPSVNRQTDSTNVIACRAAFSFHFDSWAVSIASYAGSVLNACADQSSDRSCSTEGEVLRLATITFYPTAGGRSHSEFRRISSDH